MIVKCETARLIHKNENFQLIACVPIGEYDNLAINQRYHTITIKDPTNYLTIGKIYTLEVKELPTTKYGTQYYLESIPSLAFDDINAIDDDMELELLKEIMTDQQAEYVHKAYPNFVKLVLNDDVENIDANKIYNVSDKRLGQYIRKVNRRYSTFLLRSKLKHYNVTPQECDKLMLVYSNMDVVLNEIEQHPYVCLVEICDRYFRQADVQILEYDNKWKYEQERIERMMDYAIKSFEYEGSTYVDAVRLAEYIYTIDQDVVPMLKDVALKSDIIVYNSEKNILQRVDTYETEKFIAKELKEKLNQPNKLDWDWTKYTTIKDGELTEEQRLVLKQFCESNVMILDAPSGTGKTSTLMALIHMIEDYDLTYAMMSPTGKAASRLSEQTGRPASTIHRATLGNNLYDKDVIIVDEASMMSIELIAMIFENELISNCRMVFVGDSAQIPSIGLGRVFKDMGESGLIPKCTLTKCFRFEEGGASYISTLTRQGEYYLTDKQLEFDEFTLGEKQDYQFIKFNHSVDQIVDVYMSLIDDEIDPKDIMLLVPYNIGTYGATNLNNLIQARLNPVNDDMCMKTKRNDTVIAMHANDLVMNVKNNYNAVSYSAYEEISWDDSFVLDDARKTSVFNGQTGYVKAIEYDSGIVNGNLLIANIDGEDIVYTTSDMNNLILAYASNPYKFQGSQCKYVINVVIAPHERAWNRQLLYTAQTRMTDKLIEIGDPKIIQEAIQQIGDDSRKTRLKEFLCLTS